MKTKISTLIIIALALCSLGNCYLEVVANLKQAETSPETQTLWSFIFVFLSATWVQRDAKERHIPVPFDFGFLVYLLLPAALPYHLIKTRGSEGAITTIGFFGIYALPYFLGLYAYVYFAQ
jgi:hypothetical protein